MPRGLSQRDLGLPRGRQEHARRAAPDDRADQQEREEFGRNEGGADGAAEQLQGKSRGQRQHRAARHCGGAGHRTFPGEPRRDAVPGGEPRGGAGDDGPGHRARHQPVPGPADPEDRGPVLRPQRHGAAAEDHDVLLRQRPRADRGALGKAERRPDERLHCELDVLSKKIEEGRKDGDVQIQECIDPLTAELQALTHRFATHDALWRSLREAHASRDTQIQKLDARVSEAGTAMSSLLEFQHMLTHEVQITSVLESLGRDVSQHAKDIGELQESGAGQAEALRQASARVGLLTDTTDNGQKRVKRLEKAVGLEPFEDAQEASRDLPPPTPLTPQQLAICNRTFSEFDADGSGTMDLEELGSAMRRLGHDLPEAILQDMIEEIDSDGDGTIDFQEFCSLAANANGGVERALENMSLVARQKAVQQSMQEHAAELRGAVRDIQDLKAGMTEQRVKVLEGQHMETCAEVERVRQGLELTQEYR